MAFQQGLSGLNSASTHLDVISRNIANSNTVGYKGGETQFADVFARSASGGAGGIEVGIGTRVLGVAKQFDQGKLSATNNPLDVAINGDGFFKLSDNGSFSYTRNGQFHLDKQGYLVSNTNLNLRGYVNELTDANGNIIGFEGEGDIQVDFSPIQAVPTDSVRLGLNLDERSSLPSAAFPAMSTQAYDGTTNPVTMGMGPIPATGINANSYNHATTVSVVDSAGETHDITLYFRKTAANAWNAYATTDEPAPGRTIYDLGPITFSGDGNLANPASGTLSLLGINVDTPATVSSVTAPGAAPTNIGGASSTSGTTTTFTGGVTTITGGTINTVISGASGTAPNTGSILVTGGTVIFDTATNTATITGGTVSATGGSAIPLAKDVNPLDMTLTLRDPNSADSLITQYASSFGVHLVDVNGQSSGSLTSLSIGRDGIVTGQYSNGISKGLAQLLLASFRDPQALISLGSNQWQETSESGAEIANKPGEGIAGLLQSGSVEDANVDLTNELVNLIVAQRLYQANAQSVKTQSDLLQTLVNMV